ncbi:ankyrin repeat domain-containing protein [Wolbachia endosymbiont of Diaphorina citri]|nr:ankyrin repeat domain-containing protein [Wolbachia endosymbiont of Diaphorina citri]QLK12124.1 ankyrin repeat domain-containing protein [Wolbachia endosymbiont of Diaphorina citri]
MDTGAQDNDGRTPLRIAAYNGNLDVVKFFLREIWVLRLKINDPYKMIEIIKVLKKEIINQVETTPNVKRWAEFFVEKLRYSIKNVAQEKLRMVCYMIVIVQLITLLMKFITQMESC